MFIAYRGAFRNYQGGPLGHAEAAGAPVCPKALLVVGAGRGLQEGREGGVQMFQISRAESFIFVYSCI